MLWPPLWRGWARVNIGIVKSRRPAMNLSIVLEICSRFLWNSGYMFASYVIRGRFFVLTIRDLAVIEWKVVEWSFAVAELLRTLLSHCEATLFVCSDC